MDGLAKKIEGLSEAELRAWVRESARTRTNTFSRGFQGNTYMYDGRNGTRLVIKAASGWGPGRLVRRRMLSHEYKVYLRLGNLPGIPTCYGYLDRTYLVLSHIDGVPARDEEIKDRDAFFRALLDIIKAMHRAGVAHADLKRKHNLLVVGGDRPCILDFGVAIIRKPGFAPLNHYLFRLFCTFDLNAWVKLKYKRRLKQISDEDRPYYHRTLFERFAHLIKRIYSPHRPEHRRPR